MKQKKKINKLIEKDNKYTKTYLKIKTTCLINYKSILIRKKL